MYHTGWRHQTGVTRVSAVKLAHRILDAEIEDEACHWLQAMFESWVYKLSHANPLPAGMQDNESEDPDECALTPLEAGKPAFSDTSVVAEPMETEIAASSAQCVEKQPRNPMEELFYFLPPAEMSSYTNAAKVQKMFPRRGLGSSGACFQRNRLFLQSSGLACRGGARRYVSEIADLCLHKE